MYCMVTQKSTVQHSVKLAQKKFMTKVKGGGWDISYMCMSSFRETALRSQLVPTFLCFIVSDADVIKPLHISDGLSMMGKILLISIQHKHICLFSLHVIM